MSFNKTAILYTVSVLLLYGLSGWIDLDSQIFPLCFMQLSNSFLFNVYALIVAHTYCGVLYGNPARTGGDSSCKGPGVFHLGHTFSKVLVRPLSNCSSFCLSAPLLSGLPSWRLNSAAFCFLRGHSLGCSGKGRVREHRPAAVLPLDRIDGEEKGAQKEIITSWPHLASLSQLPDQISLRAYLFCHLTSLPQSYLPARRAFPVTS